MRSLSLLLVVLASACVDYRYFAPRENENGTGPGGQPAAVYPLRADSVAGEVRVWSRGSHGGADPQTDEHVVELHVGFEIENTGGAPLELAEISCAELWTSSGRRERVLPTRIEGSLVAAPDTTARVHAWWRLDGLASARDLDAFTLRFAVFAGDQPVLIQQTPFSVYIRPDRRGYDPWFFPSYGYGYGYGYGGFGFGLGWRCR